MSSLAKLGDTLSLREKQVFDLLNLGYANLQIAALLDISEDTVKHFVSRLLVKKGAATRLELVSTASGRRRIALLTQRSQLTHQLAATEEELRILGESNEAKIPVVDFAVRAGIARILSDMVHGRE